MSYLNKLTGEAARDFRGGQESGDLSLENNDYDNALDSYSRSFYSLTITYLALYQQKSFSTDPDVNADYLIPLIESILKIAKCYLRKRELNKLFFFLWNLTVLNEKFQRISFYNEEYSILSREWNDVINSYLESSGAKEKLKEIPKVAQTREGMTEISKGDLSFKRIIENLEKIYALGIVILNSDISWFTESRSNKLSSTSNGGCFIATAAYGHEQHIDIDTFYRFRDNYLRKNRAGLFLVDFYYKYSPFIAKIIDDIPLIRKTIRSFLEKLAALMRHFMT